MRHPNWTRDELILSLHVYFRVDPRKARQHHPEVIGLSVLLRGLHAGAAEIDESFRSPDSIHLKLQNFLRFDPKYGGRAMKAGAAVEENIWNNFADEVPRHRSNPEPRTTPAWAGQAPREAAGLDGQKRRSAWQAAGLEEQGDNGIGIALAPAIGDLAAAAMFWNSSPAGPPPAGMPRALPNHRVRSPYFVPE